MRQLLLLTLNIAVFAGNPSQSQEIVKNPQVVRLLLMEYTEYYSQRCVGTIINSKAVLTAASCTDYLRPYQVRVRVGSSFGNSGGIVHAINTILNHYDGPPPADIVVPSSHRFNDIGILRTASEIVYVNNAVQPATFSGVYPIPVGEEAKTYGFGVISGNRYPALREETHKVLSTDDCKYVHSLLFVNKDMICSLVENKETDPTGYRIQDLGSPLYHDGFVIGVAAYLENTEYPGVPAINTRISSFIDWIRANA